MKPNRKSPLCGKVYAILADGEWHEQAELVDAVAPLVRPEVAIKTYHNKCRSRSGTTGLSHKVASGRRWAAWSNLANLRRLEQVEFKCVNDDWVYRRKQLSAQECLQGIRTLATSGATKRLIPLSVRKRMLELVALAEEALRDE